MFKVMIRDNMSPRAKEIMEQTGKIEVVVDNDKATNDPKALAGLIGSEQSSWKRPIASK